MATTFYFLAAPDELDVVDWLGTHSLTPEIHNNDQRTLLFFPQLGPLAMGINGNIDATKSPLISIYQPKVRRPAVWTIGEVHFHTKNIAKIFPELDRVRRRFKSWLGNYPIVWERRNDGQEGYGYYLVGSTKNIADEVYAFPQGLAAYEAGQYFVAEHDSEAGLDRIYRQLRLRGVDC